MRLTTKIITIILSVLALTFSLSGWIGIERERTILNEMFDRQGNALTQSIAVSLVEMVLTEDFPILDGTLESFGRQNDNIIAIQVLIQGEVESHYRAPAIAEEDKNTFQADITLPFGENRQDLKLGEVRLELSNREKNEVLTTHVWGFVFQSAVNFLVIFLLLIFLIQKLILKKIEGLKLYFNKVEEGNLNESPEKLSGNDEFGELAKAYFQMEKTAQSYSHFSDNNPFPALRVNRDGIIIYANRTGLDFLAHWDLNKFDLIPSSFHKAVKKTFSSRKKNAVKISANSDSFAFEIVYEENFDYVNIYGHDVTELEVSQNALITERENLYQMLDNLPICFHLQASDYTIPFANKMFRERFGDPEKKPCYNVMHQRNQPCDVCTTFKVFESKSNEFSTWQALDGRTYITVCTPFKDLDGSNLVMEMAMDITDQKKVEQRLLLAIAEAEKASQAKSEFLSHMSHELRTPMNAILGFTQLLLMDTEKSLSRIQKDNLTRVSSAGKHLLALINEVLDLSKIESGAMDIDIKPINLKEIVDEVLAISQPFADKNSISLEQNIFEESTTVLADHTRLKQILVNLITNAIKYNKLGGSVTVSVSNIEGEKIRIEIKDTGLGIQSDKKERIFEAFFRASVNQATIEGTGIGLTICQQLVELMGGTIKCDSVFGEGSIFYIDLPASIMDIKSSELPEEAVAGKNGSANCKGRKLLYIDDIPGNIKLVKNILSLRPQLTFFSALTGQEGVFLAESELPDLILMDIHLPDWSGLEIFNILQKNASTQNIPVVALSNDAKDSKILQALQIGIHSHITKPINVRSFLTTIDGILENNA